jgi:hypothetical protein
MQSTWGIEFSQNPTGCYRKGTETSVFNWCYFALNASSLISGTIIVWVQKHDGWLWVLHNASFFFSWGLLYIDFRELEEALWQEYYRLFLQISATKINIYLETVSFFMSFLRKVHQLKEARNRIVQLDLSTILLWYFFLYSFNWFLHLHISLLSNF